MFNLEDDIPSYKIVEIQDDSGSIIGNTPLILDDEFSIKVNSKYGQLWESSPNNLMTLLSNSFNIPSGQFALQGAQIWQSTDPISISFNVSLEMDFDPYLDVVEPALILMQTCIPTYANGSEGGVLGKTETMIEKHFNLKLKTLIPPGPNIQSLVQIMSSDKNNIVSKLISKRNGAKGLYTVKIGFATFNNVIITSVEPTFSKEYSLSTSKQKKFPVSANLSIEMSTMEVATTNMILDLVP